MLKTHIRWVLVLVFGMFALCSGVAWAADVEINEANFPDAYFRAYVGGKNIDQDKDGLLTAEEIEAVVEMHLTDKGIDSLQGIEYFTALQHLNCEENRLTELDISLNSNLTVLRCDNNQLTKLDVSHNANLEWLKCNLNQLSELDVSNNINLQLLECAYNQLTKLDVSKNNELFHLDCHGNQLTELDISQNINLEWLDCYGNQLTELDISQNVNLEWLDNSGNQMEELNIGHKKLNTTFLLVALLLALASGAWLYYMIKTRRFDVETINDES